MFDPTKPVQTRDGHKVRILCTDKKLSAYPIVALVDYGLEGEMGYCYTKGGGYLIVGTDPRDLVNLPEKRSAWVNVYEKANNDVFHPTKKDADKNQVPGRIACIELTYEVPQQ